MPPLKEVLIPPLLVLKGFLILGVAVAVAQENNNTFRPIDAPIATEELLIPDIFPDSALPQEEKQARMRLRYLESIKKLLIPQERIIEVKTDDEIVPDILEQSLEKRLNSIQEVIAYLRFIAFSIEDPNQTDQIINGLIRTHLSLDNPADALKEAERIQSNYWRVRSGNNVAAYFIKKEQLDEAITVLQKNLDLVRRETVEILRAPLLGKTINEQDIADIDTLLFQTIMLLTDTGSNFDIIRGIDMISTPKARLNTIFSYVERVLENRIERPNIPDIPDLVLRNALLESFDRLQNINHPAHGDVPHYITLAKLLGTIKASEKANDVLRYARDVVINEKPVAERNKAWISLVEPFILNNNLPDAMLSTRYISTEIDRAVGMVVLGKSIGKQEQEQEGEFAIPLLIYAADIADATYDKGVKNRIIGEIIEAQSVIGRFSDAYVSILKLDDVETRYRALATMGQALIDRERHEDAYRLITEQVPYIDMRAPILAGVARYFAENDNLDQAHTTLLNAVKGPKNFPNASDGLRASSLKTVIDTHMQIGSPSNDQELFDAVRDLVLSTNDSFLQISTLLDLADKQIDRGRFTQASRLINTTWRIIVSNKDADFFPNAVEQMISVQLRMKDLLNAFDAAVLLPTPDADDIGDTRYGLSSIKYRALNLVSQAAIDIGQVETAFRAANAIDNSAARTFALSVIPVYISEQIQANKERLPVNPFDPNQQEQNIFLDPSYLKS